MNKAAQYVINDDKVSKDLGMLVWNLYIVVVDLGIAMDFDVDFSISIDCR
jgi:hypothetical protein